MPLVAQAPATPDDSARTTSKVSAGELQKCGGLTHGCVPGQRRWREVAVLILSMVSDASKLTDNREFVVFKGWPCDRRVDPQVTVAMPFDTPHGVFRHA